MYLLFLLFSGAPLSSSNIASIPSCATGGQQNGDGHSPRLEPQFLPLCTSAQQYTSYPSCLHALKNEKREPKRGENEKRAVLDQE